MYVTRTLSQFRKFQKTLSEESPEGPFSGVLVITDEEAETEDTFCFGICKRTKIEKLPFPQDKILSIVHRDSSGNRETSVKKVLFIPALDQPLSSNRYYVVHARGRHKGKVCVCSREIEKGLCCFPDILHDKKPKPLDPRNIYQTVKINRHHERTFFAKSVAPDGTPPSFLKKKGWELRTSRSLHPRRPREALGLDDELRARLPEFGFPISTIRSGSVIVGEWYCPFMFVKENCSVSHQMRKSMFYRMTLSQYWERIYHCENNNLNETNNNLDENNGENEEEVVRVHTNVVREANYVMGVEAVKGEKEGHGGFYWYRPVQGSRGPNERRRKTRLGSAVGLSFAVVERMRRVMEEGGWVGGGRKVVRVERDEQIRVSRRDFRDMNGNNDRDWRRFGCYVLVESFGLRRADGVLLVKCVFRHTQRLRCKWE
ncbi:hypothetical protein EUTSA_v10023469mg [Eutrema salsugineum]|uniref:Uncharacterized protein n=1 Tax=Eutrema salsugineum TaxID=72664 RepID=V4JV57_EUTSA|nr:uncharacterized protein LOC18009503 [Eutrema salsugineum]ESQ29275.1 hypothetical protein EUTSA_v10023469mg [Eutrema salsugineum]